MTRHFPSLMGAALVLASVPAMADAQAQVAPIVPKPPVQSGAQPTKEALEQTAYEMRVLVNAMQSDKIEGPVKDVLFNCLYNNSFGKISETMAKVISDNAGKVDKRNPDQILFIMARVCGFTPQPAAAAAGAKPGAAPAKPATPATAKPAAPAAKKPGASGR